MAPLAAATAELCAAFVAHFFDGADEAVLLYVQQSLLTAIEEGDSLPEQAAQLEGFLPPSRSPGTLQGGLRELEHAVQHERQPHLQQGIDYAWQQTTVLAPALGQQLDQQQQPGSKPTYEVPQVPAAAGAAAGAGAAALPPPHPPLAAGAAGKQQPAAAAGDAGTRTSTSALSVSAAEFRPAGASGAALAAGFGALDLGDVGSSGGGSGVAAGWHQPSNVAAKGWGVHDGAEEVEVEEWEEQPSSGWQRGGGESGGGSGGGSQQHYARPAASQWSAAAAAAEAQAEAGGGLAAPAFLAVLADQFPLWSSEALQQLFEEQGGDIAATVQTLCSLESELEGQQQAAAEWAPVDNGSGSGSVDAAAAPSFTDDDFPSLGSSSSSPRPADRAATGGSAAGTAQYASAARAAADLPAERTRPGAFTHPPRRAIGSSNPAAAAAAPPPQSRAAAVAAAAGLGPAPIWQQEEGVARYATGKALAAEYAELRADARDHARLRNAFFQQATQAYQAGDRRLAKELGARGRWHNEQMHAAHQEAASQLFAQRNAAPASPAAGCGGRQGGGVPTIDLHGLHVSEALDRLEALLTQMRGPASGGSSGGGGGAAQRRLRIVVGEGKHGRVPARLPACVRRFLEGQGVAFTEPYAGLLEIRLE